MNPEELKTLRALLGEDFSLKEIEEMAQQDPGLLSSASVLSEALRIPKAGTPPLSPNFTAKLLGALPMRSPWLRGWEGLFNWKSLSWVGAAAAFLGLAYLGYQLIQAPEPPIAQVQEQKLQKVHFRTHPAQAQSVSVAGDFNQWVPWPLTKQADGSFAGEWEIPEGSYAYSYLLDGNRWVPDEARGNTIEDGFGKKNTLLNL